MKQSSDAAVFATKTVRARRRTRTKNAAQANDRARRPEWRRAACTDDKPEPRFSGVRAGFRREHDVSDSS
jgi:hypothetical protein